MKRNVHYRKVSPLPKPMELFTPRLHLRPLELSDAARTQQLFPTWEIVRFLNAKVPWPYPEDGALSYYRDVALPAVERGDEWHWTLRLRDSPAEHIGTIGLMRSEDDNRGFWLGLPWQGRGLMTEAVAAVNDFWFDVLGFEVLRAPKAVANTGSRRVSERTGMRVVRDGEREYVSGRLPSEIWEITAEEWRAWRERSAKTCD
jgi:RimJ/RimL family protein N-acetyltransferase